MLTSLNLTISSACGANCIFCPVKRGKRINQKLMPFETAQKIIDEVSTESFKKMHTVKKVEVGENGDSFINKNFIEILRYAKQKLPDVIIHFNTNFQNFTKDKAEIIIKEKLVDVMGCNLDGYDSQNYFNSKGLNLEKFNQNLKDFLSVRQEANSNLPLNFFILTLNRYIQTIYRNFGFYPSKLKNKELTKLPDDFFLIKKQLEKVLDPKKDIFGRSNIVGWAEREKVNVNKINYKKYTCPLLDRIKEEAFIAPNGDWYACCLDADNELVLGNVIKQSIDEIYFSEKRKKIIQMLKNKQFLAIGGPCKTVNCCQLLEFSRLKRFINQTYFLRSIYLFLKPAGIWLLRKCKK